jgi:hypothetical protein
VVTEVAGSTSEQSGVRQLLAGIVVGEKNRCVQIAFRARVRRRSAAGSEGWQGQFQGQFWGQRSSA